MKWNPIFLCRSLTSPIILSDGRVTTCTHDHTGENAFGSVYEQSFTNLMERYRLLRLQAMEDFAHFPACRNCYQRLSRWRGLGVPRAAWIQSEISEADKSRYVDSFDPAAVRLNIELASVCNLRCTGCGVSSRGFRRARTAPLIDMDLLLKWVDDAGGRIAHARLYHMGETWAHPRWAEACRLLKAGNPKLTLFTSTNGMLLARPSVLEQIPGAGIDHIMFSIHGACQESVERYMGAEFHLATVLDVAAQLASLRKSQLQGLYLSWKYLLFAWNDSDTELDQARQLADANGFDEVHFTVTSQPAPSKRFHFGSKPWNALVRECCDMWPRAKTYHDSAPMTALYPAARQRAALTIKAGKGGNPTQFRSRPSTIERHAAIATDCASTTRPRQPGKAALIMEPEQEAAAGRELLQRGMPLEALIRLERAEKAGLDQPRLYQDIGDALVAVARLEKALALFEQARRAADGQESEFLTVRRGRVLRWLRRWSEAEAAYRQAISTRESKGGRAYGEEVYLELAETLMRQGREQEAEKAYRQWVEHAYLYDRAGRVLYCPIPKNACTFLKAAIVLNSPAAHAFTESGQDAHVFTRQPGSGFHLEDISHLEAQDHFSFLILRNPYQRLVSAYANLFVRPLRWHEIPDASTHPLIYAVQRARNEIPDLRRSISFDGFVRSLQHTPDVDMNYHWRPQRSFFSDPALFDHIGRVEDLDTTLQVLRKRLRWDLEGIGATNRTDYLDAREKRPFHTLLPHQLLTLPGFPSAGQLYTPELHAIVRARYAADFALYKSLFGVDPDLDAQLPQYPTGGGESCPQPDRQAVPLWTPYSPAPAPLYPTGGALALAQSPNPSPIPDATPAAPRRQALARTGSCATKAAAPYPEVEAADGAQAVWSTYEDTLWAAPNGTNERCSHDAPGRLDQVLKRAFDLHAQGRSVRILLRDGIYRTSASVGPGPDSGGSVAIEAEHPGQAILSGADTWEQWESIENRLVTHWPFKWGMVEPLPSYGNAFLETPPLLRRREMVFFSGELLRQVSTRNALTAGTYCVDEDAALMELIPPADAHPGDANIEVAVRSSLMRISGRTNILIRGLRFERDASFLFNPQCAALQLTDCRNVLVEGCRFEWNNAKGLQLDGTGSADITLRRISANRNGCLGLLVSRVRNLLLEECETSLNNWRGGWVGSYRRSACGIKVMRSRGVTLRVHRALHNAATGIWIDEANTDIRLERCMVYGNYRGVHLEAGIGPASVLGCQIVANRQEPRADAFRWAFGSGIVLTHMPDVLIRDCFIADNDTAQIGVRDDRPTRRLKDPLTGEHSEWRTERTVLVNNLISAAGPHRMLLHIPCEDFDGGRMLTTLKSNCNRYMRPNGGNGFLLGGHRSGDREAPAKPERLDFSRWRERSGQDEDSEYDE